MRRGFGLIGLVVTAILLTIVGVIAYNIGWSDGVATHLPAGTAAIRPETFRVCYMGFLTMDITQRITDRVAVSPTGIKVTGAQLPSGHHHLLFSSELAAIMRWCSGSVSQTLC